MTFLSAYYCFTMYLLGCEVLWTNTIQVEAFNLVLSKFQIRDSISIETHKHLILKMGSKWSMIGLSLLQDMFYSLALYLETHLLLGRSNWACYFGVKAPKPLDTYLSPFMEIVLQLRLSYGRKEPFTPFGGCMKLITPFGECMKLITPFESCMMLITPFAEEPLLITPFDKARC